MRASDRRTPAVSIVLGTNRDTPFLAEALESVRQQTVSDWDLLVVDNGLRNPQAVRQMITGDDRMRMITIDSKATAGIARNVGVSQTSGELVTYLDDDDVWAPERLERHLEAHERHPEAPASFSGYWHVDATGQRFGVDWRSDPTTSAMILSGERPTPVGGTVMVRRQDYVAIGGFSPEIAILVDFEFALRLAQRGELIYIDDLLFGYRRHSNNMTSTAPENARKRRRVMEQMVERQRWSALDRGEPEIAALLEQRLRRHRMSEARTAGSAVFRAARRGQFGDAAQQSAWSLSRAPLTFLAAASAAPIQKVGRLVHRD